MQRYTAVSVSHGAHHTSLIGGARRRRTVATSLSRAARRAAFPSFALLLATLTACVEPAPPPVAPGVAYVVAFGEVPRAELDRARLAMADLTGRPVVVLPARALTSHSLSGPCRDDKPETPCPEPIHDAAALLDRLLLDVPADAFRILGVTAAALDTPDHETLIGFARHGERGLVYSTHDQQSVLTEAAHRRRVRHVVAHELGHTFGATHCTRDCVMRDALAPAQVDLLTEHPCPRHRPAFAAGLAQSIDTVAFLADLGAERMRIGRWSEAVAALEAALRRAPRDARLRTSLGVALMGEGRVVAADEVLREASRQAPRAPQPYYARAALYAAGYAPFRAPAFLEAAVERDGDATRAHRAAGIFYQDVLEKPDDAIRHYEAHLRLGGRDPQVIARLVYLLSPTTLTFSTGEVIIARFEPGTGLMVASLGPRKRW